MSGNSRRIVSASRSSRPRTSSSGRLQFSVENAKTASESTPKSRHASTVRRSARVPALCPASTGRPRERAQRALPSMMIATERATSGRAGSAGRDARLSKRSRSSTPGIFVCQASLPAAGA